MSADNCGVAVESCWSREITDHQHMQASFVPSGRICVIPEPPPCQTITDRKASKAQKQNRPDKTSHNCLSFSFSHLSPSFLPISCPLAEAGRRTFQRNSRIPILTSPLKFGESAPEVILTQTLRPLVETSRYSTSHAPSRAGTSSVSGIWSETSCSPRLKNTPVGYYQLCFPSLRFMEKELSLLATPQVRGRIIFWHSVAPLPCSLGG